MQFRILVLCALLCGCVTRNTLVPVTSLPVRDEGCSCCSPLHVVAQDFAPGATLLMSARPRDPRGPYISVGLALAPGVSASFVTPNILVWAAGGEKHAYPIESVSSGSEHFPIPIITYSATALLTGTSRMAHLKAPYGPVETFSAGVALSDPLGTPLFIAAPSVRIGETTFQPEPVQFNLVSESVACVQ